MKPTAPLTIEIKNLKALQSFRWRPSGVCALVGPNGSGKSTALRVLDIVRLGLDDGMAMALRPLGGGPLLHWNAPANAVAEIKLSNSAAVWTINVERTGRPTETAQEGQAAVRRTPRAVNERSYEIVTDGGSTVVTVPVEEGELALRALRRRPKEVPGLYSLSEMLMRSRYFSRADLEFLRTNGSSESAESALDTHSKDLFTVLKNWRLNSDHEHRLAFVTGSMRELFPGFRGFDFPQIAQRTSAKALVANEKLDPTDWSDGFFCCLSMLTGLASVEGGYVSLDEPENSLHPELIRQMIEFMREWSRTRDVTVLLATHSPVLLDQFREVPEQVFVMQSGRDQLPVALDELKKREWLSHFSLGDLYSHLEVGARAQ